METTTPGRALVSHCHCGGSLGTAGAFGPGFSYSLPASKERPNILQAVAEWERAMLRWLDLPDGWYREQVAAEVAYWRERLLDYGVDFHSPLGCSLTPEEGGGAVGGDGRADPLAAPAPPGDGGRRRYVDHYLIEMSAEEAEIICAAMHIGGDMRRVLILGCVQEKTLPEIAAALEKSEEYVAGLLEDAQLLATEYGTARSGSGRDIMDAIRNTQNTNPHTPTYATNEYTGELQKVQLRTPWPNEGDLGGDERIWRTEAADELGRGKNHDGREIKRVVKWVRPQAENGST